MLNEAGFKLAMTIIIPVSGSIGYIHGTFATKAKVNSIEEKVVENDKFLSRMDKLICKMAIRQKLKNAEEICTNKE